MRVSQAKNYFFNFHRMNSKKNTLNNYQVQLSSFCENFGDRVIEN